MRISTREVWSLIWRSLKFVWPYRYQIGVKILLSLLGLSVVLYLPWPLKILIDHVVMGMPIGDSPTPFPPYVQPLVDALEGLSPIEITWAIVGISLVGIFLIGAFNNDVRDNAQGNLAQGLDTATQSENQANESSSRISGLIGLFEYRYQLRITHRINHRLRGLIFDRLLQLPMTRFADESVGDAIYRVMYDTPAISRVCYDILVTPISSLYVIGLVIYTTEYSFQAVPIVVTLAWIAAPLTLITSFTMTGLSRRRSLASREAGADTTSTVEEGMSNILAVQSLGANDRQRDNFDKDSETSFDKFRSYLALNIILGGLQYGLAVLLVFILFFDVCEAVIAGTMSPGDFGLLFAYFLQLYGNTTALGALWFYLQDKLVAMKRVYQIIDTDIDADVHGERRLERAVQNLKIESASYTYPDGTEALHDIDLTGEVGQMIALVGGTGAGKTTLSYLMPGFVSPTQGRVTINDVDIKELELPHLRDLVTFVFQEPMVFDDTLGANIRFGEPEAEDEAVMAAARTAGAAGFIEATPDGLQTRCGRAGSMLSVGQKQRLAIARGLVSQSPILILDEPTAALDPETENALVSALQKERDQRLLVVIAHRLSTIRSADRIYFMEDGRIIESGDHDTLMEKPDGAYRRFVELQTGYQAA